MNTDYTRMIEISFDDFTGYGAEEEALDFLKQADSFRGFGEGLTVLLGKYGYSGDLLDAKAKGKFLWEQFQNIGVSTERKTVNSWFEGTKRPPIQNSGRQKMFEICFALHAELDDVKWLFHHVYLDRCFNFHLVEESVYYYCFKKQLTYQQARYLIEKIDNGPESTDDSVTAGNYTIYIKHEIDQIETEEELIKFLISEKHKFKKWNLSANQMVQEYCIRIFGAPESREVIQNIRKEVKKKLKSVLTKDEQCIETKKIETCGLLVQEMIKDGTNSHMGIFEYLSEYIKQNVFSSACFLKYLDIDLSKSFKKTDIPYIIANNFPSAKILSNVLDDIKIGQSVSYDSIRKVLVLLKFYVFWCNKKVNENEYTEYDKEELCEVYIDEANFDLNQAGFEDLFAGNPYDWIFMLSARKENPLEFFRSIMAEIMCDGDE